jgi:hypothetical protein
LERDSLIKGAGIAEAPDYQEAVIDAVSVSPAEIGAWVEADLAKALGAKGAFQAGKSGCFKMGDGSAFAFD